MPTLFERLRGADPAAWHAYTDHAFVRALGDGSLPRPAFLHYLRQDYVFLIHFARAWALGVVKSDRIGEMRRMAGTVQALTDFEMRLHIETCAAAGIDQAALDATREEPENLAYMRFVLDTGLRGDLLDLLAALSPCVLGYGEIGRRLAESTGGSPPDHPYAGWITTYADAEFRQVGETVAGLMDDVCARLVGPDPAASPRWRDLCGTFATACRLEAGFWDMGLRGR